MVRARVTRRTAMWWGSALVGGLVAAACGAPGGGAKPGDQAALPLEQRKATEYEIWIGTTADRTAQVDAWNAKYPNLKLTTTTAPSGQGQKDLEKFTTALAEGSRHTDELVEEIGSESASVDDFLARKFGFCVQQGDALLGFCCSEYNRPGKCELGAVTLAPYRHQGVATLAVAATAEEALRRGIGEIGWHCWASNAASLALAAKVGFELVEDYSVWLCRWSDQYQ